MPFEAAIEEVVMGLMETSHAAEPTGAGFEKGVERDVDQVEDERGDDEECASFLSRRRRVSGQVQANEGDMGEFLFALEACR